jgi:hypothetical protein
VTHESGVSLSTANERRRDKLSAVYEIGYSDGKIDDHDANVTGLHDWLWLDSRWLSKNNLKYFSAVNWDF